MLLIQSSVPHLTPGIDLSGKTAVVTGATAGIGFEISRQLLTSKISNLILAVRNVSKGETARQSLISDPDIKLTNPGATIKVLKLDMENYGSVKAFVASFEAEFVDLHLLMLNAGIGTFAHELASTGHEKNMQVNYLSNVLLNIALLPMLEATAQRAGKPTRVTWTGSRMHKRTSLEGKTRLKKGEALLQHIDTSEAIPAFAKYSDSKLLVVLFQLELARRYAGDKVIVNNFCPGMINTGMSDVLPIYLRIPMNLVKAVVARNPEKAGWIALNAGVVVGAESHGRFLEDMVVDEPCDFVKSDEGRRLQKLLWDETCREMEGLIALPAWMRG
ncbi:hypothetical protein B0J13DRAFT_549946 [Dactylonectria estremocensis]|uniref:Uncharacterized protein n=1 Tax=Dactylonectria estremocensis TaxID=1079267 RepID=A0A9P9F0Z6_9HYPO|nr:hypothetical protein B0J13DRAFT_549946 [Dactylonectria estremocensis]